MGKIVFKLAILNAKRVIFTGEASGVIITGDESEYELLPYHSPLMGVLRKGDIVIDNKFAVPVEKGIVKFFENECVILAEERLMEEEKGKGPDVPESAMKDAK